MVAGLMPIAFASSAAGWGTLLEEPGEGVSSQWVRNSTSYMNIGGLLEAEQPDYGGAMTMITAEDGTVWIDYPISSFRTTGWLTGKIEGDKMTFSLPQCIVEDEGTPFYLAVVDKQGVMYQDQTYTFSKVGDNWVSDNAVACLGIVNMNSDWMYCSDFNYTITPFTSVGEEAPAGLATKSYAFRAGESGHYVKIGFDGNDVWIKGLLETSPDNWLRGTREGNTVTFRSGAYLGTYDSFQVTPHHVYFMACDIVRQEYEGAESIDFKYDESNGNINSRGSFVFNFSDDPKQLCYLQSADEPQFVLSEGGDRAMTPSMPSDVVLTDESVISLIPQVSDDDELLDADKLYYIVYVGDKPVTFTQQYYYYLDMEEMTEVPYNYTDNYDFIINGTYHEVYLYNIGNNPVGIQTVYYGGGERRVSDILYSDHNIVPGDTSVDNIESDNDASEVRFDLSGRRVSDSYRGITVSRKGKKLMIK